MQRSAGVTTSGVVVIAGSAFTVLCGALMCLASAFISNSNPAAKLSINLGSILIVEAIFVLAFGGWGLSTGIGLLYLKQWARISLLIYAGILVFFSLPAGALMLVVPIPNSNDPNLPSNFASGMRIGMAIFYAAFAALGGFWLYFFNKGSVKAQFQGTQRAPESAAGDSFLGVAAPAIPGAGESQNARPVSITIIGWFLLISSALAPLFLLINPAMSPGVQFPLYFLGFFFFGKSAYLIFVPWMLAQVVAAAGLLKLKRWGFFTTIGLQSLAILNGTLLLSIPGHRAKFQQIIKSMMTIMNARMPQPAPELSFPAWIGFAISLPIVLVILWFLITRRQVFTSDAQEASRQHS